MRNRYFNFAALLLTGSLAIFSAACRDTSSDTRTATRTDANGDVEVTTAQDGTRTEVRDFDDPQIARATRVTRPDGTRTAYVEYRDGRRVDIDDDNDVERIMKESAEWVANAADRAWDATKDVGREIGDKSEDVADKVVDTSKEVGKKTAGGVKKVGKKLKDIN